MNKRQKKKLLGLVGSVLIIGLSLLGQHLGWFEQAGDQARAVDPGLYSVTRFSDGDTITVDMNGQEETIRMIGVDTPETHHPDLPVQCYGPAASAYTKNLIGSQKVRLEADPTNQNRDRYNRLLRYVYLPDGTLVQAHLVQNGYGFAYTSFPFTKSDEFVRLQQEARENTRGLWGNCAPTENDGRWQSNAAG